MPVLEGCAVAVVGLDLVVCVGLGLVRLVDVSRLDVLVLRRFALVRHVILQREKVESLCTRRRIVKNLPSMQEFPIPGAFSSIAAFAEELDAASYPGGGSAAALVAALAASLAAAAADRSRAGWEEAGGARAQAQALRRRAIELAERDAAAYAAAREALAQRSGDVAPGGGERQARRDWQLGSAVEQAAGPPLELAARAADIAELAAVIATRGAGDVRADAVVAAMLAAAASRAAAQLVQVNLVVGEQQPGVVARRYADAAAAAAAAAEAG
jgi:formiminotetrahydrofolate cyclodeaminase